MKLIKTALFSLTLTNIAALFAGVGVELDKDSKFHKVDVAFKTYQERKRVHPTDRSLVVVETEGPWDQQFTVERAKKESYWQVNVRFKEFNIKVPIDTKEGPKLVEGSNEIRILVLERDGQNRLVGDLYTPSELKGVYKIRASFWPLRIHDRDFYVFDANNNSLRNVIKKFKQQHPDIIFRRWIKFTETTDNSGDEKYVIDGYDINPDTLQYWDGTNYRDAITDAVVQP